MCVLAEFELVDDLLDDGRIGLEGEGRLSTCSSKMTTRTARPAYLDIFDTFRGDGVNLGLSDSWRFEGLQ
jgi:hypothetical protein